MEFTQNDFELLNSCPWCHSSRYEPWGQRTNHNFITVLCKECGLIYVKKRLNKTGLKKYYSNYLQNIHQSDDNYNRMRDEMYKLEFKLIDYYCEQKVVLDIGVAVDIF